MTNNEFFNADRLMILHNTLDEYVANGSITSEQKKRMAQSLGSFKEIPKDVVVDIFNKWLGTT